MMFSIYKRKAEKIPDIIHTKLVRKHACAWIHAWSLNLQCLLHEKLFSIILNLIQCSQTRFYFEAKRNIIKWKMVKA